MSGDRVERGFLTAEETVLAEVNPDGLMNS